MRIEDMKNWTVDQLKKEVVRLSEECEKRQHEILDLQEYQIELERDCDVMMMYGEPELINDAQSDKKETDFAASLKMYKDQHQSDCITINQLQTALDVLVDRYANLRRTIGNVFITRNGEKFCDVRGSIERAKCMINDFLDHPMNLNEIDFDKNVIGRKVWWRSEPAVVTRYISGQACVILEPDGIPQFTTPAEFAGDGCEYYVDGDVKADILDKHIWWFRK